MKIVTRFLLAVLSCAFSACLFQEPIFTEGFAKTNPRLGGTWAMEGSDGTAEKAETAVCAPLDDGRYILHYPTSEKGGMYYEARPLMVRDRMLMQLRILASFTGGIPKADVERYTLIWIEKDADGQRLRVRALGGDGVKGKTPAEIRKALETPSADWGRLFGEPAVFHLRKDR